MISHPKEDLLSRLPNNSYRADLTGLVEAVYAISESAGQGIGRIKADRNLSEEGKREAIKKFIGSDTLQKLAEPSRRYGTMLAQIVGQRKELGKPEFKADALSIADRQEVRSIVRAERDPIKKKLLALEFAEDKASAEAILSGSSLALTGLSPVSMKEVRQRYLEKFHGEEKGRLDSYRENVAPLGAAISLARNALHGASGMHSHDFEEMLPQDLKNIAGLEAAL